MESFLMTLRIFSFLSTVAIIIVLYANIQPFLLRYTPWMTLWYFILILAMIGLTGMGLVHKFVLPFIKSTQDKEAGDRLERIEKMLIELTKKENK
jgi:hypothetical protein